MPYNKHSKLWGEKNTKYFSENFITPITQKGPHCVSTCLAMLTDKSPEYFQKIVNTQDPVSWSDALKAFGMKLAYCPTDLRKLKYYQDELLDLDDLFVLCYYTPSDPFEIFRDPRSDGWICGSHIVILHFDQIIDPQYGVATPFNEHGSRERYTKRIFRVIPIESERGL